MKLNRILVVLSVIIIFASTLTGAFCLFSAHRSQTLHATTGVSIQFVEDDRIFDKIVSSQNPQDLLLKKENPESWWCKKGTTVSIDASIQDGYIFEGWYHNDVKISDTLQTDYMIEGYTLLSAHLSPIDESEDSSNTIAFAIYSADDHSLSFYKQSSLPNVGETYHNKTVTAIYPDIEAMDISGTKNIPWYKDYAKSILIVDVVDKIRPINISYWFYNMNNCDTFYLENLDTSQVSSMKYTFYSVATTASSLVLDLNHWDTSNVTAMTRMFNGAGKKAKTLHLNLSSWNTSNVTDMSYMFYETGQFSTSWTVKDLSTKVLSREDGSSYLAWEVSSVTNMLAMFACVGEGAEEFILDIHNWNISSIQNLTRMFNAFRRGKEGALIELDINTKNISLENGISYTAWDLSGYTGSLYYMFGYAGESAASFSVDLSNWDVSNVTNMNWMFYGTGQNAKSLYLGDLSLWNTGNVTSMDSMFQYTGENADFSLDLSGWDVSKVTSYAGFAYGTGTNIILPNF